MIGSPNKVSPALCCGFAATIGGLIGGITAVHGLGQNRYGPLHPPALINSQPTVDSAEDGDDGYGDTRTSVCTGCSERDLGYRWAIMTSVSRPDQCPEDSWGFRRGCLDYVGGA